MRQLGKLYRVRWQVELAVKRLKSLLHIGPPQGIGERTPLPRRTNKGPWSGFTPALQCTARDAEPFGELCFGQGMKRQTCRNPRVRRRAIPRPVSPWRAWHVRTDRLHHYSPSMPERKWQFTGRAVAMAGPTRGRSIGRVITCGRLPRPSLLWPPDTAGRRDGWRIPARLIDLEGRPPSCRAALSRRQTPRASSIRVSPAKALVRNFKKS